jgi:hypothetical protein
MEMWRPRCIWRKFGGQILDLELSPVIRLGRFDNKNFAKGGTFDNTELLVLPVRLCC